MRVGIATASAVLLAAMASVLPAQSDGIRVYSPRESDNAPQLDLWLDQAIYRIGDRIAPHFVTEAGAYVTIVRITSDGQLTVLYPRRPREQKPYSASQLVNDRVPLYLSSDNRFQVEESRGIGFVFAIASWDKFNYNYYGSGGEWSIARLANDGRYGDPFEIVRRFVDRTLSGSSDFSLDYVSYEVYNDGPRSRYASRYDYSTIDDYYDSCISAFGLRYTPYCRNYYPGYYGPYIVSQPRAPTPNTPAPSGPNYAGKKIHPVIGDPLVHGAPTEPEVTEGRLPPNNSAEEAALAARRERMARQVTPRDRSGSTVNNAPVYQEPRVYSSPTRTEPVYRQPVERQPVERPVPVYRPEPRVEQRAEPRPQPVTPARVEVRNEPRQAQPAPAPAPRQTATPVAKDNDH